MNIKQLKYFSTIAQLNNLSKASEILGVNQPTLSKSISSLEEELGMELFYRNGKKISLNPQGERFLECVDQITEELGKADADMREMLGTQKTCIRIGAAGCYQAVTECAAAFKSLHPDCEFIFDFDIEYKDDIDIKNYDAVIYPDEIKYARLDGIPVSNEKYVLAVSKAHPLASSPATSPKALEGKDIVFIKQNDRMDFAYFICKALDIRFNSVMFADSRAAQYQMIAAGLAVGIIPESSADVSDRSKLAFIPFFNKNFSRSMLLSFRKEKHLSPIAAEFKQFLCSFLNVEVS